MKMQIYYPILYFLDSNTIYTSREHIAFVERSVSEDSTDRNLRVKENIRPTVERFVNVNKQSTVYDFDYLVEFKNKNDVRWLPVKLPKYLFDFNFEIDTTQFYYKKLYFPKPNKLGRCGFIYHSFDQNYTLILQSGIINGSSPLLDDIKQIINSVVIKQ